MALSLCLYTRHWCRILFFNVRLPIKQYATLQILVCYSCFSPFMNILPMIFSYNYWSTVLNNKKKSPLFALYQSAKLHWNWVPKHQYWYAMYGGISFWSNQWLTNGAGRLLPWYLVHQVNQPPLCLRYQLVQILVIACGIYHIWLTLTNSVKSETETSFVFIIQMSCIITHFIW